MSELQTEETILETLKSHFGAKIQDGAIQRKRRINITVSDPVQRELVQFGMEKYNAWHLFGISGVDTEEAIMLVYHFDIQPPVEDNYAITLSIHVVTDRDQPKVQTVSDLVPGSGFFEREAHDLLGVVFEGNTNLDKLILPDDWPEGVYPLRKDFLLEIQKEQAAAKKE